MNTQQLAELLKTWPEFEGRLEWLEQYPPDTPIMDALRNAPCGGCSNNVDSQWLSFLTWLAMVRVSEARRQYFEKQTLDASKELVKAKYKNSQELEADITRAGGYYDLGSIEGVQKAHKEAVCRAHDKRYRANHEALVNFIEATNGLFEALLEVLYNEHKEIQRALGDMCDDLAGRG